MHVAMWARASNFGDQLNLWLWPRMLENFFEGHSQTVLYGIGTLLSNQSIVPGWRKVVLGTGAGYGKLPRIDGNDWILYGVRGPRTAAKLNLDPALVLGDPGFLIGSLTRRNTECTSEIGFMPHLDSAMLGGLDEAAEVGRFKLIDPRWSPAEVIDAISSVQILYSEAMHGVIAADALRVPWIPVLPASPKHIDKWLDVTDMLKVDARFTDLYSDAHKELIQKYKKIWKLSRYFHVLTSDHMVTLLKNRRLKCALSGIAIATSEEPPAMVEDISLVRSLLSKLRLDASREVKVCVNQFAEKLVANRTLARLSEDVTIKRIQQRLLESVKIFATDFNLRFKL